MKSPIVPPNCAILAWPSTVRICFDSRQSERSSTRHFPQQLCQFKASGYLRCVPISGIVCVYRVSTPYFLHNPTSRAPSMSCECLSFQLRLPCTHIRPQGMLIKGSHSLVSIGAYSSRFVVHRAVHVRAVVEGAVSSLDRPAPPLVHEMPVEACERSVLVTLVLEEGLTLFHSKFLEIPGSLWEVKGTTLKSRLKMGIRKGY